MNTPAQRQAELLRENAELRARLEEAEETLRGEVTVGLERDAATNRLCLRVRDNGVGLPEGLDWRQSRSMGFRLVPLLAGQLNGVVKVRTGGGTEFEMTLGPPDQPENGTHE